MLARHVLARHVLAGGDCATSRCPGRRHPVRHVQLDLGLGVNNAYVWDARGYRQKCRLIGELLLTHRCELGPLCLLFLLDLSQRPVYSQAR